MRKNYWMILGVCLTFLFVSAASADMYVGVKTGYAIVSDTDVLGLDVEFDGGWIAGIAVGTKIQDFRVEGELEYKKNDVDVQTLGEDTLETWSLLVNGFYDLQTGSGLTPYIGAGIGFANHDVDDEDDTVFAYQGTAGVAYAFSETMDLDCAYRYLATADPDFAGVDLEYGSHNFTVGIRFKF